MLIALKGSDTQVKSKINGYLQMPEDQELTPVGAEIIQILLEVPFHQLFHENVVRLETMGETRFIGLQYVNLQI